MSILRILFLMALGGALALTGAWFFDFPSRTSAKINPPSRSQTTLEEAFPVAGVTGEVREALLIQDLLVREEAVAGLLQTFGPESLESVRKAYESVLIDLGDSELVLFGTWWARFDPRAAVRWTDHHWPARYSTPVVKAVFREWGRSDPDGALIAARAAPNQWSQLQWSEAALRGWDESRLDGALEYAENLPPGMERQWALYTVTRRRVLRDGPADAIAWAEALPEDDPKFKANALMRVATATAFVDPAQATALAERHIDGPYYAELPWRVAKGWFERAPEETMIWLSSLPDGEARDEGVKETFRSWLRFNTPATISWIEEQPSTPWVDPAHSLYATFLAKSASPRRGIEWTTRIVDDAKRQTTQGQVARIWLAVDPVAANQWLEGSELPPEFIQRVRSIPEPMQRYYEENPPAEFAPETSN